MYIARLSKKSKNGDFSNFACNEINNLQTSKSLIWGFPTVSADSTIGEQKCGNDATCNF